MNGLYCDIGIKEVGGKCDLRAASSNTWHCDTHEGGICEIKPAKPEGKQIYAVDIDGTIADGKFWEGSCTPRRDMIKKVNDLYKTGKAIVIYHTARHPDYYGATYGWLVEQGCYFHALEMGKLTADFYIDDRNLSIEDFMDGKS